MRKKWILFIAAVVIGMTLFLQVSIFSMPSKYGYVDLKLFLADSISQPLIVGFGGSEGGNVLASDQSKPVRDKFLSKGYAFLAVGYFGSSGTPSSLDRISLNAIHDSIAGAVRRHPEIDSNKIALYGGSRGGELVLNLASRYKEYDAVIAIAPSNVSLPTRFGWGAKSSWTFFDKEVPYITGTNRRSDGFFNQLSEMLKDEQAVNQAAIQVERINGPILLLSAIKDEAWPSTLMCNEMVDRLNSKHFNYQVKHVAQEGTHAAAQNSELILEFVDKYFPGNGCQFQVTIP